MVDSVHRLTFLRSALESPGSFEVIHVPISGSQENYDWSGLEIVDDLFVWQFVSVMESKSGSAECICRLGATDSLVIVMWAVRVSWFKRKTSFNREKSWSYSVATPASYTTSVTFEEILFRKVHSIWSSTCSNGFTFEKGNSWKGPACSTVALVLCGCDSTIGSPIKCSIGLVMGLSRLFMNS